MKGYEQFFEGIQSIFADIRATQGVHIEKAAQLIAESVINDGLVHIFGTGHSNVIAEEVFGRANTLAPINQVVDLSLARSDNLRWLRQLHAQCPSLKMILLSVHDEPSVRQAAMEAGANGFVLKRLLATDLLPAVEAVLSGRSCGVPATEDRDSLIMSM